MDLEVNCYLDRNKMREAGGLFVEDYNLAPNLGAREYFRILLQKIQDQKQQQQAQSLQSSCNGSMGFGQREDQQSNSNPSNQNQEQSQGQGNGQSQGQNQSNGSGNQSLEESIAQMSKEEFDELTKQVLGEDAGFDSHEDWPKDMDGNDAESLNEMIESLLEFAAEETEKNHGTVPGEIAGRIEQIRKKPKPVTDWKRYFRRYLGNEFSEQIRKSRKSLSRRFPDAPGNKHRRKSHILVAIDTSGSVSMPEYHEFFGQIKTLSEKATFHVVECDTRIQHEYDYHGKENDVLHGGGGTDFQPVIDLFLKDIKKYDCLVYFTDGESNIPKNTPKETLWVISSKGRHDKKRYAVNGAKSVFIKPKQK